MPGKDASGGVAQSGAMAQYAAYAAAAAMQQQQVLLGLLLSHFA